MNAVPIMLVDDHPIMAEGIRALLAADTDLRLCHVAADATAALAAQRECPHRLAIVDVALGRDSGLQLVATLKKNWPELAVLVLSMHDSELYARDALDAGASAYLSKQEAPAVLLLAIRGVLAGCAWSPRKPRNPDLGRLGAREREVLRLIGQGHTNQEIAQQLERSIKTVESHREHIKEKLGLTRGSDLVRYALLCAEGNVPEKSR